MTRPFGLHVGVIVPLMGDNVDTDQIIPSREIKSVSRDGLADGLFAAQRYLDEGTRSPDPDFALNQDRFAGASIILSGANFGCGSSREHAVWALVEYGIRAVIAVSFGDIFYNNCIRNGVLPIVANAEDVAELEAHVQRAGMAPKVEINLPGQTVTARTDASIAFPFELAPYSKRLLGSGLDPIALTLESKCDIIRYLAEDRLKRPWVYLDHS